MLTPVLSYSVLFFFNDTATTEIYTLSLHDALPILLDDALAPGLAERHEPSADRARESTSVGHCTMCRRLSLHDVLSGDRKSTRLNSSHGYISYAVFCLKKKNMSSASTDRCWSN